MRGQRAPWLVLAAFVFAWPQLSHGADSPAPWPEFQGVWAHGQQRGHSPGVARDAVFWIGSLSKQFTAAAALRLVERGQIELDTPVTRYFPELNDEQLSRGSAACTVKQLLHHTCGLPEELIATPCTLGHLDDPARRACFLAGIGRAKLAFTPGSRYAYSNIGYDLVGLLLADLSGKSYAQLLQQEFFDPLGMAHTGVLPPPAVAAKLARGELYLMGLHLDSSRWHQLDIDAPARFGASGNLYSTLDDMLVWTRALHTGKVLSPASYAAMVTPGEGDYGMGMVISKRPFGEIRWHTGALSPYGYNSFAAWLPERRQAAVVLSNRLSPISHSGRFAESLITQTAATPPGLRSKLAASTSAALLLLALPIIIVDLIRRTARAAHYPRLEWLVAQHTLLCALTFILVRFREPTTVWLISIGVAAVGLLTCFAARKRLQPAPWLVSDRPRSRQLGELAISAGVAGFLIWVSPAALGWSQLGLLAAQLVLLRRAPSA